MGRQVDWYFDFISPFAYLQFKHFHRLPDDLEVTLHPLLFAGLLNHWEHKGPAEIPAKRTQTYQFTHWHAEQLGVPFRTPPAHPFNPLPALRLAACISSLEAPRRRPAFLPLAEQPQPQPSSLENKKRMLQVSRLLLA